MTTPAQGRTFSDELANFAKLPAAQLVAYAVSAVAGVLLLIRGLTGELVVTCNSRVMAAGESCTQSGRRGRGTFVNSYADMSRYAERALTGQVVAGALVLIAALLMVVALLRAWRRDATLINGLRDQQPEASLLDRSTMLRLVGVVLGMVALGGGGYLTFRLRGVSESGSIGGTIIGVAVTLVGVLILAIVKPRGASLALVHPDRLTVVTHGQTHQVPWSSVQVRREKDSIGLTFADPNVSPLDSAHPSPAFVQLVEERSTRAVLATAPEALAAGQAVSFGDLSISSTGLTLGGTFTPFAELVSLQADQLFYTVVRGDGAPGAKAQRMKVHNVAALRVLLQQQFGLQLP